MIVNQLIKLLNDLKEEDKKLEVLGTGPNFEGKFGPRPIVTANIAYLRAGITRGEKKILWLETSIRPIEE